MKKIKIGINGLGRIGRTIFRAALNREDIQIVGINDLYNADYIAYLIKYDTFHGVLKHNINVENGFIIIDGKDPIRVTSQPNPEEIKWGEIDTDYVIESSAKFLTNEQAKMHLKAGAKNVVMSAPAKDEVTPMFVCGVNLHEYNGEKIVSNSSCTTNCTAPIIKIINDAFGIENALMTTIHPVTASQKTVDSPSIRDPRAGRSGLGNIIPYSTTIHRSIGRVIPDLKGKFAGICFRVPTQDVSAIDLTLNLKTPTSYENICRVIKEASLTTMKGIIKYSDGDIVSSDCLEDKTPSIFDASAGISLTGNYVKIIAWYDNEIGYSNKILDLIAFMNNYKTN